MRVDAILTLAYPKTFYCFLNNAMEVEVNALLGLLLRCCLLDGSIPD